MAYSRGQQCHDETTPGDEEDQCVLPEEVCKHTLDDWKDSAASYVRQHLFDKKQFVSDVELKFGSTIQKLVCSDINISEGRRAHQLLWDEKGGKETVRNSFCRKRQSAQNAMKIAFRGKCDRRFNC